MTSATKINQKSKWLKFQASRNYKANADSKLPYEELIVTSDMFPDKLLLVHKNLIFGRNTVQDTSYEVFSFTKDGDFIQEENVIDLGREFFRTMVTIKKL